MTMVLRPVFNKGSYDYPFEGCQPGLAKSNNMYFRFIVDTLRDHLGDDLDFTEENGRFILPYSAEDLNIVKTIYSDTGDFLSSKLGRANLWFELLEVRIN